HCQCSARHRDLHTFPTRRSSDLKLEKTSLKRVDSSVADKLIDKAESLSHVLSEDESTKVKEIFEKAINNTAMSVEVEGLNPEELDRKSTRLNSSHVKISYAVFCL